MKHTQAQVVDSSIFVEMIVLFDQFHFLKSFQIQYHKAIEEFLCWGLELQTDGSNHKEGVREGDDMSPEQKYHVLQHCGAAAFEPK